MTLTLPFIVSRSQRIVYLCILLIRWLSSNVVLHCRQLCLSPAYNVHFLSITESVHSRASRWSLLAEGAASGETKGRVAISST